MRAPSARLVVAVLAAGFALASCATARAPDRGEATPADRGCSGPTLNTGDRIPGDCIVRSFDGDGVTLDEARGDKPAIFNFWASWCVYCIKEMPDFQRVHERAAGRVSFIGLDLLGVQAETEQAAQALAARTGVRYALAYDTDGEFYHRVCPCGGRPLMPATVFVRANGTVAYLKFGPLNADELIELIRTHLVTEI